MDKIERIKAEIERLRKLLPWGGSASQLAMECNCKNEAYDEILAFIDSLQEIEGTSSKFPIIPQDKDSLHIEETCKENEDSFTHSLEEAANDYAKIIDEEDNVLYIEKDLYKSFEAGAEWMREQMMEGAVEGFIGTYLQEKRARLTVNTGYLEDELVRRLGLKSDSKVKLIILKDNDTQGNA